MLARLWLRREQNRMNVIEQFRVGFAKRLILEFVLWSSEFILLQSDNAYSIICIWSFLGHFGSLKAPQEWHLDLITFPRATVRSLSLIIENVAAANNLFLTKQNRFISLLLGSDIETRSQLVVEWPRKFVIDSKSSARGCKLENQLPFVEPNGNNLNCTVLVKLIAIIGNKLGWLLLVFSGREEVDWPLNALSITPHQWWTRRWCGEEVEPHKSFVLTTQVKIN